MAQQHKHKHKLKEHHYVHPINIVGEGNGKKKREKFALSKFRVTKGMGQVDETFALNLQQAIQRRKKRRHADHRRMHSKKEYALFESIAFQIKFLSSLPYEKRLMVFDCFEIVQVESHTVLFHQGDVADAYYITLSGSLYCVLSGQRSEEEVSAVQRAIYDIDKARGNHFEVEETKRRLVSIEVDNGTSVCRGVHVGTYFIGSDFGSSALIRINSEKATMGLGDTCTTSASDVGGRRLATVVAMENTMLIKLTRDAWLGIEKRWEIYEHHLIENTLRTSPLLAHLKLPWEKQGVHCEHFVPNEAIRKEGDMQDFIIVVKGSVRIITKTRVGLGELAVLGKGSDIGASNLLYGGLSWQYNLVSSRQSHETIIIAIDPPTFAKEVCGILHSEKRRMLLKKLATAGGQGSLEEKYFKFQPLPATRASQGGRRRSTMQGFRVVTGRASDECEEEERWKSFRKNLCRWVSWNDERMCCVGQEEHLGRGEAAVTERAAVVAAKKAEQYLQRSMDELDPMRHSRLQLERKIARPSPPATRNQGSSIRARRPHTAVVRVRQLVTPTHTTMVDVMLERHSAVLREVEKRKTRGHERLPKWRGTRSADSNWRANYF